MIDRLLELLPGNARFLEILSGGGIVPAVMWLTLLTLYLTRESERRGLSALDWLHLPPSMNLILALYLADIGVLLFLVWLWRMFAGAGTFGPLQSLLLMTAGAFVVIGGLCKIRALTAPDHGNLPWFLAGCATLLVMSILLFGW